MRSARLRCARISFVVLVASIALALCAGVSVAAPSTTHSAQHRPAPASKPAPKPASKPAPKPAPHHSARHYGGPRHTLGVHGDRIRTARHPRPSAAGTSSGMQAAADDCGHPNMCNHGGPVMSDVVIYNIYWVPAGQTSQNQGLIDRFTEDLGGPFVGMLGQYGVPNRVNYGGSWIDTNAYPTDQHDGASVLRDSDIQAAASDAANANPGWQAPGLHTLYMVYLATNTELCNDDAGGCTYEGAFCAYHGSFSQNDATFVYGAMPADGDRLGGCGIGGTSPGPNGDTAADAEISTASHEIFEAMTDPEVQSDPAWTDGVNPSNPDFLKGEIGDMCAYVFTADADHGNITLNGNRYFIQEEWSNATQSCEIPSDAIDPVSSHPACTANTLPRNDDGSTEEVQLPFSVDFFSRTFNSVWVNNNGNITFDGPQWTYTPYGLQSTAHEIIAPFFADVDTRAAGSAEVTYGGAPASNGSPAYFCVDWLNVGYYGVHSDRLNSFQLMLVDRSAQSHVAGDFDIVFNYGKIQWETGDASYGSGGLGGDSAVAGYSNGSNASLEMLGSAENGALLDGGAAALIESSRNSSVPGRYVYAVRNGGGPTGGSISGTVRSDLGTPVAGPAVQACSGTLGLPEGAPATCYLGVANDHGAFSFVGLPADTYELTVNPPSNSSLYPLPGYDVVVLESGQDVIHDLTLGGELWLLPPTVSLDYERLNANGVPILDWGQRSRIHYVAACSGGTATAVIRMADGSGTVSIGLAPDGGDSYAGTLPDLKPLHGAATLTISVSCPDPADNTTDRVTIYIDPSGTVVDTDGQPIQGATVTLLRADDVGGPFLPVPDGSALMSPGNRANPDLTTADGRFGWDVLTGFYEVQASKDGCTDPSDQTSATVTSAPFQIPPPMTDLQLVLDCPAALDTTPPVIATQPVTLEANVTGGYTGTLSGVTVTDPDDASSSLEVTNDAPSLIRLGTTTVTWQATDPAGNEATPQQQQVTVVDTTPPGITCPADVDTIYVARPALGTPSARDVADPAPSITNDAPSNFALGTTTVTWTARDASGNDASCTQRVSLHLPVTATVAGGDSHSLALLADGTVRAWGAGGNGQLGTGGTSGSTRPVVVPVVHGVTSVCAGGLFSMALEADGTVWAWGDNGQGQLGDGTTTQRLRPQQVTGLPAVYAIACGRYHALAVGLDGQVWAWGSNTSNQSGQPNGSAVTHPTRVSGATGAIAVAAGEFHSLALRADGTVLAWGANYDGQLGDGTTVNSRVSPTQVLGLTGVTAISAGWLHSLAVASGGHVYAWGLNSDGELGDGTTTNRSRPVAVGVTGARSVAGGADFSLGLGSDGTVRAWGANKRGQLGDGTTTARRAPVTISLTSVSALAAGSAHSVAGLTGGQARAWGYNASGQLGNGSTSGSTVPVAVSGITSLRQPT